MWRSVYNFARCVAISQCSAQTASVWLYLNELFRRKNSIDKTREAQISLRTSIADVTTAEQALKEDLSRIARQVKESQKNAMHTHTKQLLLSSRAKRQSMHDMQRKRAVLEKHQEALLSCDLNEKVLASMKQTSGVLKDIGMDKQLAEVDETIMDLQENTAAVGDLSRALGESFGLDHDDDEAALQDELNALLDDEWERPIGRVTVAAPPAAITAPTVNSRMQTVEEDRVLELEEPTQAEIKTT